MTRAATTHKPRATMHLPQVLDLPAAQTLAAELLTRRGAPAEIDASAVQRVGAQALQVLLSARKTWASDGQDLTVCNPSTDFIEALDLFGAAPFGGASVE